MRSQYQGDVLIVEAGIRTKVGKSGVGQLSETAMHQALVKDSIWKGSRKGLCSAPADPLCAWLLKLRQLQTWKALSIKGCSTARGTR